MSGALLTDAVGWDAPRHGLNNIGYEQICAQNGVARQRQGVC